MIGPIVGSGGIRAINARYITITHAQVEGPVRVTRDVVSDASTAIIANNLVNGGFSIVVKDLDEADVRWNRVTQPPDGQAGTGSDIGVIDTASLGTGQYAEVIGNTVRGNLWISGNVAADVKGNTSRGGSIVCTNNLNTDARDNRVLGGGRLQCDRDLFPGE